MKQKIWVFIGRLNPPHKWHIKIIETSLWENHKSIIILGSTNKNDEKNPLDFEKRKHLLYENFRQFLDEEKLFILPLKDEEEDIDWIKNLETLILWELGETEHEITFYWWDFENDNAIQVIKDFQKKIRLKNISYKEITRKKIYVEHKWKKYLVSSTQIRKHIKEKNYSLIKKFMGEKLFNSFSKFLKK